ncbi:Nacht, Lrr And Pyd Domains-Containing Protein 4 [Manis pentadactyla]|nr:Nacht, Lrr And Pyd Domains-Containing Protein 4 [Manis pentadactyla]
MLVFFDGFHGEAIAGMQNHWTHPLLSTSPWNSPKESFWVLSTLCDPLVHFSCWSSALCLLACDPILGASAVGGDSENFR